MKTTGNIPSRFLPISSRLISAQREQDELLLWILPAAVNDVSPACRTRSALEPGTERWVTQLSSPKPEADTSARRWEWRRGRSGRPFSLMEIDADGHEWVLWWKNTMLNLCWVCVCVCVSSPCLAVPGERPGGVDAEWMLFLKFQKVLAEAKLWPWIFELQGHRASFQHWRNDSGPVEMQMRSCLLSQGHIKAHENFICNTLY